MPLGGLSAAPHTSDLTHADWSPRLPPRPSYNPLTSGDQITFDIVPSAQ